MIQKILITVAAVGVLWLVMSAIAVVLFVAMRTHEERRHRKSDRAFRGLGYVSQWPERRAQAERDTYAYLGVSPDWRQRFHRRHDGGR